MGFETGNRTGAAGRPKGSRTRLSGAFLSALAADFEEHGMEAIRITRIEHPDQYVKIVASLMPREFTLEDNRMTELSDTELDFVIEYAKRQLASKRELAIDLGSREGEATYRVETRLLQAIPEAS
jgi:hypothetical protein